MCLVSLLHRLSEFVVPSIPGLEVIQNKEGVGTVEYILY
jgi:hypothetical protein